MKLLYSRSSSKSTAPAQTSNLPLNSEKNQIDQMQTQIIVTDINNRTIRQISEDGTVSTLCGSPGKCGSTDGKGSDATFNYPHGITFSYGTLFVADGFNHRIRRITEDRTVSTLCGSGHRGSMDGEGAAATFNQPYGIAASPNGTLFVADFNNHTIRKITEDGTVSTFCGFPEERGFLDGKGSDARFYQPYGIAVSSNGTLFVSEYGNNSIRKITADGTVSTLCGTGHIGSKDGKGSNATFHSPCGIAVSPNGTLFVADSANHTIRKITKHGTVSTLCGSPEKHGSTDGKGSKARFDNPSGIAISPDGTLFVTDRYNHRIRRITQDGTVSTLCGSRERGSTDGNSSVARFNSPCGIALKLNMPWTPKTHLSFPLSARKRVMTVLMMAAKRQDGTPWHPESHFHSLPRDILFIILHCSISYHIGDDCKACSNVNV